MRRQFSHAQAQLQSRLTRATYVAVAPDLRDQVILDFQASVLDYRRPTRTLSLHTSSTFTVHSSLKVWPDSTKTSCWCTERLQCVISGQKNSCQDTQPVKSAHAIRDYFFICLDIAHIGDEYLACGSCSVQSSLKQRHLILLHTDYLSICHITCRPKHFFSAP